ncbi:peptidyl-prolyl cis-trans isomerase [Actibacterium lipolyticum]|uniref:Parvulin-like PPIase n=1 Tax=Actibacterium lipolyticum TaxID=1524263 RepID=A0A238KIE7_9RHOB|nr:peptidyl-prolyl cis-trans isomerase [Actibacterium lipolyticum]SMX42553.1 Peptidyl-prolyl cis-trans isomerase D [Actibacterium lipolyticum]
MGVAKKTGNVFVWIILLLLIVGLGGFGVSNFGGSVQSIGTVGDQEISVNDYARQLQQDLRAAEAQTGERMTIAQAESFGIVANARSRVITTAALDNEVARMGVSVGDTEVQQQVLGYDAFKGLDGRFDREAYRFTLQQNGLTEPEFETQIRTETARTLLQGAVLAGISAPENYSDVVYTYLGGRRSYSMIELSSATLESHIGAPDDATLQAYYEANAPAFTTPEAKSLTYVSLTPETILGTIDVDAEKVRALYDERLSEYQSPERRLVERLVYPTQEEAAAAKARLDAGEAPFEALVLERGLELSDVDMGDASRQDLGAAADAVFALEAPGIVGPVDTNLGPALFRMNAILAAQETPFEDVREELESELAQDRARRIVQDSISDIDDRLAAGATLEELANETDMVLGTIDFSATETSGIAAYPAFRDAALAVQEGDFPEVIELDDGGIAALRLEEIKAPELRPLDDVREEAIIGWQTQETASQLTAQAEALKARLDAGTTMQGLEMTVEQAEAVTRGGVTPLTLSDAVFGLEIGESTIVDAGKTVFLVQLDDILPPDAEDTATAQLKTALDAQAAQAISQDIFAMFAQALLNDAGLTLNQAAINAVHAQLP